MNKAELINAIAASTELTKKDAEKALSATLEAINQRSSPGRQWSRSWALAPSMMKKRAAHTGQQPRTKEPIEIPASAMPVFNAGRL